jgi:hypothetical protein
MTQQPVQQSYLPGPPTQLEMTIPTGAAVANHAPIPVRVKQNRDNRCLWCAAIAGVITLLIGLILVVFGVSAVQSILDLDVEVDFIDLGFNCEVSATKSVFWGNGRSGRA